MKRLIKKSIHDIPNRDSAFIYINNKFYEDVTHSACLYQFLTDENKDIELNSLQIRPSISYFEDLSKEYGIIILGHLVKAEDGVFIIYGYDDGKYLEYPDISKNILQIIKNHYGMETYNDLETQNLVENNSDIEQNINKFKKRIDEINNNIKEKCNEILLNNNFKNENNYYLNSDENIIVKYINNNELLICKFGQENLYVTSNELAKEINLTTNFINVLSSCSPNYKCKYNDFENFEISCDFVNNNGINFRLISENGIVNIYSPDLTDDQILALDAYLYELTNKRSQVSNLKAEDFDLLNNFNINICNQYKQREYTSEDIDDIDISKYDDMDMDEFINRIMANKNGKRLIKKRS